MTIDRNRLFEQAKSPANPLFRYRKNDCERTKVEIVGAEVSRWPRGGAAHLGRLQCRLDDTGCAVCHLVLQVQHVFQ